VEEMDKFLETDKLLRLNHEEIDNGNRPLMSNEIDSAIKNLPNKDKLVRHWWLTPVILAIQEAEIRRVKVQILFQANSL
jgi:hypothetical protein